MSATPARSRVSDVLRSSGAATYASAMECNAEGARERFERAREASSARYDEMVGLVGQVAQASAALELQLRQLMSTLVDSKYAELVAAGLSASDLINTCIALLQVSKEIDDSARAEGLGLLAGLPDLFGTRNNLVHGMIATRSNEHEDPSSELVIETVALISKRRKPAQMLTISSSTAKATAIELRDRSTKILGWCSRYLPGQLRRKQISS